VTFTQTEYLNEIKWLDFGADYYAAVSFNDAPDNRRIMIGWMSNWDYAKTLPTEPYRGQMSIAREITLENRGGAISLIQRPVKEASHLVREIDPATLPLKINEQVTIGYDESTSSIYIDRRTSKYVAGIHRAPITTPLDKAKLSYILDSTSIELFINDGAVVITDLFFA
jgi:sucrose-6-phosphate hydrolase SacC (GH32 family)